MHQNSINKKIFLISFISICLIFLLLFFTIFYSLPLVYLKYKDIQVNDLADNSLKIIDENLENKKISKTDTTTENQNLIINEILNDLKAIAEENNILIKAHFDNPLLGEEEVYFTPYSRYDLDAKPNGEIRENSNDKSAERNIEYGNVSIKLSFFSSVQPVGEVQSSLKLLVPSLTLISLIIAIVWSIVFANYIAAPIKKIRKKSIEIENFNFDNGIVIKRNDEIGELSTSLDSLSQNLKKAMSELQDDVELAQKKERERRQYVSIISHELKTPLTIIRGQSECMIENIGDYKDHNKYLLENISIVDKMEGLVQDMLASCRIDSIEEDLNLKEENIKNMIIDLINNYSLLLEEKNLEVSQKLENVIKKVDPNTFNSALKNIFENAIKYSKADSTIEIILTDKNLKIINDNDEVTNDKFQNIFEPFVRIDDSRNSQTGGTGIGLYIVKKTLDIHKYKYSLSAENGKVTFLIEF